MRYGIALDLGTSGFRCQAVDLDTGETVATAITERHPIPGMNVIDHVNFAMKAGEDVANGLMIETINNLFAEFGIDLSCVEKIGVCGNPFQLSLFQNIEIRDLAYAGKNMLKDLGVVSPPRNGDIVSAESLGLKGMPKAEVIIPPAVRHEIGADAIAMMMETDILDVKEPCIVVDYGTNAEMALVVNGKIYSGSAAAGPALEGQQIQRGMLAAPGALSEIEITDDGWKCYVLDDTLAPVEGDVIDPLTGKVIAEGPMHGKAVGITGTGVIAALANGMRAGIIVPPKINTPTGTLILQDGIEITSNDVDEAGKAIGALRAGFLTLMDAAGLWVDDVRTAYMSGASGLYVDARKAMDVGMVTPGAKKIIQFGNTSIGLARKIVHGQVDLDSLREFAKQLRADHVMFATSDVFKNLYSVEYSVWCTGMPMSMYNDMLDMYSLKHIPDVISSADTEVTRLAKRDLPDTEKCKVRMIKSGMILSGVVERCIGCKKCVKECPEKALTILPEGVSKYKAQIESDRCAGTACRRCERICPEKVLRTLDLKL
ncbi:methylamine methyltransferase corrinoid protein reductive activase [Candidatus Methanoprimaticola sp. MG2]|uniref:methylamine methyltransferase corrinoid protein reductive activase n=1 Tax=Candidatus Methanoprimaticola sp. MG2 TaxID=3228838 RepID=UPI0039C6EC24